MNSNESAAQRLVQAATLPRWCPLLLAATLLSLSGCAAVLDVGYYWQSVSGHVQVMRAARPVPEWLQDSGTSAALRGKLEAAQRIRRFAVTALHLPDNPSYQSYADLKRSAVVWNVVAAPADSLTLKTWCFPVTGCVGYRGYFAESDARALVRQLQAEGLEVSVYGVPAYSTLGKLNWAGGDPLLSTFIHYPEGELARLVFHELAHQVVFAAGDTQFNESFATAVERLGAQRWLAQSPAATRTEYETFDQRRRQFKALTLAARRDLATIYESNKAVAKVNPSLNAMKEGVFSKFRQDYALLKQSWGGYAGYDPWVARANNAALGAQAAYDDLVPAFEALFAREGGDWARFYDAVQRLADLPQDQRHKNLKETPSGGHSY
ncbi:MAG: aminopeptidase [Burkholderiaceae bacterium]